MEIQRQRKLAKWNEIMDAVRPYFKDGALPDAGRDVRDSLLDPDLDSSVDAWLYSIVSHLNHEIVRDDISLDECYEYFKEAVQNASRQKEEARKKAEEDVRKQVDLEKNVPKKKSIFERFRGMLGPKEEIPKDTAEETFETQRKKQMGQDEEIRNVVIYQRRVIDGKEVLVPLDNSEFKVVRR